MKHVKIYITLFSLVLFAVTSNAQTGNISLTLQVKDTVNKLPKAINDWFAVDFICIIKNDGKDTVYFVNPEAYKIFPHPWTISINGSAAKFWPGDTGCAPPFTTRDIIKLAPQDTISKQFNWHSLVSNFSQQTGQYKARVKYHFTGSKTFTMGADTKLLSDLESNYSNEITFSIVD